MAITINQARNSLKGQMLVDLAVRVSGSKLVVAAGTFTVHGTEYELTEDEEFEVVAEAPKRWLDAWLVKLKDTGEVRVVMDDRRSGEPRFDWDASNYARLHNIYLAALPENGQAADAAVKVFHIADAPEPKE